MSALHVLGVKANNRFLVFCSIMATSAAAVAQHYQLQAVLP
jgi:hypothetical protein